MFKAIVRLYIIHLSAISAIAFSMYFPGLDLLLALLYLFLIWLEGLRVNHVLSPLEQAVSGFLWQLPSVLLVLAVIWEWDLSLNLSYYLIFIMQIWQTPILPFISLVPTWIINARPFYYYLLLVAGPLMILFYTAPAYKGSLLGRDDKKMNPLA